MSVRDFPTILLIFVMTIAFCFVALLMGHRLADQHGFRGIFQSAVLALLCAIAAFFATGFVLVGCTAISLCPEDMEKSGLFLGLPFVAIPVYWGVVLLGRRLRARPRVEPRHW